MLYTFHLYALVIGLGRASLMNELFLCTQSYHTNNITL